MTSPSLRIGRIAAASAIIALVGGAFAAPAAFAADRPSPAVTPTVELSYLGDPTSTTGAALANRPCDVNGDGFDDAIVGAWQWKKGELSNVGAAYVILGTDNAVDGALASPSDVGAVRIDGPDERNSLVAFSVGCAGDVNGDGFDDVVIGNYIKKRVFVVLGAADFTPLNLSSLGDRGYAITVPSTFGNFGYSVAPVGDVDADGYDDIGVGELSAGTDGRTNNGRIWVIKGKPTIANLAITAESDPSVLLTVVGAVSQQRLSTVADAGDVNGDGVDDVILGSYTAVPWGSGVAVPGAAYVIWGTRGGTNQRVDTAAIGSAGFTIAGPIRSRDRLGISVAAVGDLDGDGKADLAIGADGVTDASTGPRNGGVAVVYGSASTTTVYTDPAAAVSVYSCADGAVDDDCIGDSTTPRGYWINGAAEGDSTGSVAGIGDVNGDGTPDLAIGAAGFDPADPSNSTATLTSAGRVWIVFGDAERTATLELGDLDETRGTHIDGRLAGERFGRTVGVVGDFDANGTRDLAIGADFSSDRAGRAAIELFGPLATAVTIEAPKAVDPGEAFTVHAAVSARLASHPVSGGSARVEVDGAACASAPIAEDGTLECDVVAPASGGDRDVVVTFAGTAQHATSTATIPLSVTAPVVVTPPTDGSTAPVSQQPPIAPRESTALALRVSLSDDAKVAGAKLRAVTNGLRSGESYTVSVGGRTVDSGSATAAGRVSSTFTIPRSLVGVRAVTIVGDASDRTGSSSVRILQRAKTLGTHVDRLGSGRYRLEVSGLAAGESVRVFVGGHRVSPASAEAKTNGKYVVRFSATAPKSVRVYGAATTRRGTASIR